MPGRNDWSNGFTKSANKTKFIRKRDVKLKDSEVKKDQHICQAMCEGICRRCIDKAKWRFQFDKYKPLKNIANCRTCKQKVVTKAYRNLCDPCATRRKVCPSCEVDMEEANRVIEVATKPKKASAKTAAEGEDEEEQEMGDAVMDEDGDEGEGECENDAEAQEGAEEDDGEEDDGGEDGPDDEAEDMEEDN